MSKSTLALIAVLMSGSAAIAQTTAPPVTAPAPATTAPAATTAPSAATTAMTPVDSRGMLASNVMKASVRNSQNERVGEIDELVIDPSGKITQVIVGVGGFLGIGEHKVALDLNTLKPMRDGNTLVFTGNFTKDSLKSMAQWRDPTVVTGTGTGVGTGMGAGGTRNTTTPSTTTTTTPSGTTTTPSVTTTTPSGTTTTTPAPQR